MRQRAAYPGSRSHQAVDEVPQGGELMHPVHMAAPHHRAGLVLLAVAVLSAACAACTTTPSAAPSSATLTSTTPARTVIATSSPPTTSAAGPSTVSDERLAIEAVQRYYAAFNEALVTLKTTEMRTLFQPGCLVCEQDVAEIDKMARDGERVTGGSTSLRDFVVTTRSANHLGLRATGVTASMVIRDRTGKVTTDQTASEGVKHFSVFRRDGTWILEGIT